MDDQTAQHGGGNGVEETDEGRICDRCGGTLLTVRLVINGQVLLTNKGQTSCNDCLEKAEVAHERELKAIQRATLMQRLEAASHKDERLEVVSFSTFAEGPHNRTAKGLAEKWVVMQAPRNVIIHGPVGCGKTYLARCMRVALTEREIPSLWLSVGELVEQSKRGWGDREAQQRAAVVRDLAKGAPVLFLDDLGKNKGNGDGGWMEELLYSIVDPRYRAKLPTVVTTEWTGDDLVTRSGKSVVSRLEHGAWILGVKAPKEPYRRPAS